MVSEEGLGAGNLRVQGGGAISRLAGNGEVMLHEGSVDSYMHCAKGRQAYSDTGRAKDLHPRRPK